MTRTRANKNYTASLNTNEREVLSLALQSLDEGFTKTDLCKRLVAIADEMNISDAFVTHDGKRLAAPFSYDRWQSILFAFAEMMGMVVRYRNNHVSV